MFKLLTAHRPLCNNINAAIGAASAPMVYREITEDGLTGHSGFVAAQSDGAWIAWEKNYPSVRPRACSWFHIPIRERPFPLGSS